jgi:hypothetical protein
MARGSVFQEAIQEARLFIQEARLFNEESPCVRVSGG